MKRLVRYNFRFFRNGGGWLVSFSGVSRRDCVRQFYELMDREGWKISRVEIWKVSRV